MCEKLETADAEGRKTYLRSVIAQIEVGARSLRLLSTKAPAFKMFGFLHAGGGPRQMMMGTTFTL